MEWLVFKPKYPSRIKNLIPVSSDREEREGPSTSSCQVPQKKIPVEETNNNNQLTIARFKITEKQHRNESVTYSATSQMATCANAGFANWPLAF